MKDQYRKTYPMQLTVKTPMFIGGGETMVRMDYILDQRNRKIHVLDEAKFISFLADTNSLDIYSSYIEKAGKNADIRQFLEDNQRRYRVPDIAMLYKAISSRSFSVDHLSRMKPNEIHLFIRDYQGRPYIPGSTLKGMIADAIMGKRLREQEYRFEEEISEVVFESDKKDALKQKSGRLYTEICRQLFEDGEDSKKKIAGMSGISVSDSEPFSQDHLRIYQKKDIAIADAQGHRDKENSISLYRECIEQDVVVRFTLSIDSLKLNQHYGITDIQSLLKAIQGSFDSMYSSTGLYSEYKKLNAYLPNMHRDKTYCQIGGGAGFHSKTIIKDAFVEPGRALQVTSKILSTKFFKHNHLKYKVVSPKCIKVAEVNRKDKIMGICELTVLGA